MIVLGQYADIVNQVFRGAWDKTQKGELKWKHVVDLQGSRTFCVSSSQDDPTLSTLFSGGGWVVMVERQVLNEGLVSYTGWMYEDQNSNLRLTGTNSALFQQIFEYCNDLYEGQRRSKEEQLVQRLKGLASALNNSEGA